MVLELDSQAIPVDTASPSSADTAAAGLYFLGLPRPLLIPADAESGFSFLGLPRPLLIPDDAESGFSLLGLPRPLLI